MISQRVKQLRQLLSLTQPEFGKRLGVSRDVINNLELGRVNIKEVFLDHICLIYGVNAVWLYEGEGEIFDEAPKLDKEFKEALEIFGSLSPRLKAYALNQMRGLLDIQNSDGEK